MSPVFQVEMRWRCSTCKTENLGRHKKCQSCGKPKGREAFYDAPGTETPTLADAVTDPDLVRQAKAGSDWECVYCGSHQRRDSGECANCGSKPGDSREHKTKWDDGTVGPAATGDTELEGLAKEEAKLRREIQEEFEKEWSEEGGNYRKPPPPKKDPGPGRRVSILKKALPWPRLAGRILTVVLAIAVVGSLGWFLFRTRIVDATVTALAWQHTVHVDRYQYVQEEGFDPPGDGDDVSPVGMRHHHYRKVPDGTRQVPYTETYSCGETCTTTPVRCSSNGNGFKTCSGGDRHCSPKYCTRTKYRTETKYRDESVSRMWYRWKAWRWKHNRDVVARGTTDEPRWPSDSEIRLNENLGSDAKQERAGRETSYEVTFTDTEGDKHELHPDTLEEFLNYPMGTARRLKVGVARGVEVLPPGKE